MQFYTKGASKQVCFFTTGTDDYIKIRYNCYDIGLESLHCTVIMGLAYVDMIHFEKPKMQTKLLETLVTTACYTRT